MVTGLPGPKGKGLEAKTPLKSFEVFFDNFMRSKIVTSTNQKIEKKKRLKQLYLDLYRTQMRQKYEVSK